jgi:hypothetical protein
MPLVLWDSVSNLRINLPVQSTRPGALADLLSDPQSLAGSFGALG